MNKWKKKDGIAIAVHSFIASEKKQLSIIVGDHIQVNSGNNEWLLGPNLFTHKGGIFPVSCVSFIEKKDFTISTFLSHKSDILIFEAQMTIRYAFIKLQTLSSDLVMANNSSIILNIFNRIKDLTSQIDACTNYFVKNSILEHFVLSSAIDNLRELLGLSKIKRSLYSNLPTISTWERKTDPSNPNINVLQPLIKSIDQPIIFHFKLSIKDFIKPVLCRIYLYDGSNKVFLSSPITIDVDLNQNQKQDIYSVNLIYENFEKKYMSNNLYLIIYSFDSKDFEKPANADNNNNNDNSKIETETYSMKRCSSCAIFKLPELTNDSLGVTTKMEMNSFSLKRENVNILTLTDTISNNLALFQVNSLPDEKSDEDDDVIEPEADFDKKVTPSARKTVNNNHVPLLPISASDTGSVFGHVSPPASPRSSISTRPPVIRPNIPTSFSSSNLRFAGAASTEKPQSAMISDAFSKLSMKIVEYPLNISVQLTPYSGCAKDIFMDEGLHKMRVISPLKNTSIAAQDDARTVLQIQLKKLKLDFYHKYALVVARLLDVGAAKYVECFQSFEDSNDFGSDFLVCPVIKSSIDDQFTDTFSINLNATGLPDSSLVLVIEVYKINSSFNDAKPQIAGYGLLSLFVKTADGIQTPLNEGEFSLYNSAQMLSASQIASVLVQDPSAGRGKLKRLSTQSKIDLKSNGAVSYRVDSNLIRQYIDLFKIFHHAQYTEELKGLINNFMFSDINEWERYSSKILLNLCSIISSAGTELANEALRALQHMLSSLNTRNNDSLESLFALIEKVFTDPNNAAFSEDLRNLADVMLPFIVEKLKNNPEFSPELNEKSSSDSEFRNLIKILPLFLHIASRSYSLKPSYERKMLVRQIFDLLNQLLKKDPSNLKLSKESQNADNQELIVQKEAQILMNQRLILAHFLKLVNILPICFDINFASEMIYNFITSIRDDKESLFQEKMKLLLKLSSEDAFWVNNMSKDKLNGMFIKVLDLALKKSNYLDYFYQILTSIMYSSDSRFVLKFLPLLEKFIDDESNRHDQQLIYMLFTIAFNFPESFPLRILHKLIFPVKKALNVQPPKPIQSVFIVDYDEILKNSERLFIYVYVLFAQRDDIIKKFRYKMFNIFELDLNNLDRMDSLSDIFGQKIDATSVKYKLFLDVFNIAISTRKPELSPFDSYFASIVYGFNNDFSVLNRIFKNFTLKERLFIPMIKPLLHCMIIYPSKDLASLFYSILKADIKLNRSSSIVRSETLNALWEISSDNYSLNGKYYCIADNEIKVDEFSSERKSTLQNLYEFNGLCKESCFVDLAKTLFSKDGIPSKSGKGQANTPKYKKGPFTKEEMRKMIEEFACDYSLIVSGINEIRFFQRQFSFENSQANRLQLISNEDKLSDSIQILLNASSNVSNSDKFKKHLIEMICKFHLVCGNSVEAACSLDKLLSIVPCTNELVFQIKRETLRLFIETEAKSKAPVEAAATAAQNSSSSDENILNNSATKFKIRRFTQKPVKKETVSFNLNSNEQPTAFIYDCIGGWNSNKQSEVESPFCTINGREFHVGVLLKIIDLCIKSNNESLANKFIEKLIDTCIKKFRLIELMPHAFNLKKIAFQRINSRSVPPSSFYRVTFYGTKFDSFYRNRTFIYRRDYKLDGLTKFKNELKVKFPQATIDSSLSNHITSLLQTSSNPNRNSAIASKSGSVPSQPPQLRGLSLAAGSKPNVASPLIDVDSLDLSSQMNVMSSYKGQLILVQDAVPASKEELDDPFFMLHDARQYVSDLSGGSEASIFRCETFIEHEAVHAHISPVCQHYLSLPQTIKFPTIQRRLEVDVAGSTVTRKLDPLSFASLSLQRNINGLLNEEGRIRPLLEKLNAKGQIGEFDADEKDVALKSLSRYSSFLSFLMQQNAPYWICLQKYFLDPDYAQKNNDDAGKVRKLQSLFNTILALLEETVSYLRQNAMPAPLKKEFDQTIQLSMDLKQVLSISENQ